MFGAIKPTVGRSSPSRPLLRPYLTCEIIMTRSKPELLHVNLFLIIEVRR